MPFAHSARPIAPTVSPRRPDARTPLAGLPDRPTGPVDDFAIGRTLDDALSLAQRRLGRPLDVDLDHLESLQALAVAAPNAWRLAIGPRREEAALWLYTVAVGVGAMGLPDHAVALLDVLPGVPGGARGRRGLLCALLASAMKSAPVERAS